MPAVRRPSWVSIGALVVGATLLIVGLIFAVSLGPSGRVQAATRVASPGVVVIGEDVLRASSAPVHVAIAPASGQVSMVRMLDGDARAALESTQHSVIDGVAFLPPALRVSSGGGDGAMPRSLNADTFLDRPVSGDRVATDVMPSRLPQALLVYPGAPGQSRDDSVEITMTWSNSAWFWQSVALAALGAAGIATGLVLRRRGRTTAPTEQPGAQSAERPDDESGEQS